MTTALFAPSASTTSSHWLTKLTQGQGARLEKAKQYGAAAAQTTTIVGVGAVTSAALAYANVHLPQGLDMRVGKEKKQTDGSVKPAMCLPIDGVAAILGIVAGIAATPGSKGPASMMVAGGAAATNIWVFRKTQDFATKAMQKKTPGRLAGHTYQDSAMQIAGKAPLTDEQLKTLKAYTKDMKALQKQAAMAGEGGYYFGAESNGTGFGAESLSNDPILEAAKALAG